MSEFIIVPIQIEGMFLSSDRMVTAPLADFSKLPWNNGLEDFHFDQPFVADGIVHQAFSSENYLLKQGLHLHFILPHYLGQHIPETTQLSNAGKLPAAPNRWIVTRCDTQQQWHIVSDYIHATSYDPFAPSSQDENTCIVPYNQGQPYRYMGQKTLLNNYIPGSTTNTFKSLNNGQALTVIGYGDINFSSFYPNCLGVFGFHDANISLPASDVTYTVLGWHADEEDDVLYNVI